MELHPHQFTALVSGPREISEQTFSNKTHLRALVSLENIKGGDLFRHLNQHETPYQQAAGPAKPDPEYPKEGHSVIPIPTDPAWGGWNVTPHQPAGRKFKVIRQRKKPRP